RRLYPHLRNRRIKPPTFYTVEITQEKQDAINIVSLQGRLDAGTSPSLEEKLDALVDSGEAKVLVDCRELDYISSAGLRVLLAAAKKFKKLDGSIALATLNPNVKQVFEISGFTSIFPIYATREEAVQALS
ncbi:MAG: STAS domain-containing protein, partial [Verrucomicrobiota bacterium]